MFIFLLLVFCIGVVSSLEFFSLMVEVGVGREIVSVGVNVF